MMPQKRSEYLWVELWRTTVSGVVSLSVIGAGALIVYTGMAYGQGSGEVSFGELSVRTPADRVVTTIPVSLEQLQDIESLDQQAKLAEGERRWSDALPLLNRLVELKPTGAAFWLRRGNVHGELGQWKGAAADFAKAIDLDPQNVTEAPLQTVSLLAAGDIDGYRKACRELLARYGRTEDASVARALVHSCEMAPNSVPDLSDPVRLGAISAAGEPATWWFVAPHGRALYRAGRLDEGLQKLMASLEVPNGDNGYAHLFLAMIHQRLGHPDQARHWLNRAEDWEAQNLDGRSWSNRLLYQIWSREATELLNGNDRR